MMGEQVKEYTQSDKAELILRGHCDECWAAPDDGHKGLCKVEVDAIMRVLDEALAEKEDNSNV